MEFIINNNKGEKDNGGGGKLRSRMFWIFVLIASEMLVPLGWTIFLPLFGLNFLMRWLGPKINSKLGNLLTGMSAMAASDEIYTRPLFTVLLHYFVDRHVDIEEHRRLFQSKVVDARKSDGRRRYPELRKYISNFCGYTVWHKDDSFRIENHIRLCDPKDYFTHLKPGQLLDERTIMKSFNDILIKPFDAGRSPWEILIFYGAKTKSCPNKRQSLIIFRYHHALSDGYSITKLMSNVTTGEYFQSPHLQQKVPQWKFVVEMFFYPFVAVFVGIFYLKKYVDENDWSFVVDNNNNKKKVDKIRDMVYVVSDTFPIDKIKEMKRQRSASFNGIVLQGIAGGIRKYFLEHGPRPQPMHVGLSFPVPGHPNRLTNHWTAIQLRLPLDISSPQRRLELIQEQFKTVEMKIMSKVPYLGTIYSGLLFKKFINYIFKYLVIGSTITMSIFPGPENLQLLTGEKITSGGFVLGPMSNQGVCITVVSCNGALRVFFGIEKSLLAREEDAEEIVKNITDELVMN